MTRIRRAPYYRLSIIVGRLPQWVRHTDAHRLDMKKFTNRPTPRLPRYELMLKDTPEETPAGHEDPDTIPARLDATKGLGKETEPGVVPAKQRAELGRYNADLVFKVGENVVCFQLAY